MTLISFLGFTILVAIIAYLSARKTNEKTADGYFLGGRSLTAGVIAGSLLLTNLSTEQIVGLNGSAYESGLSVMAWETLAAIAMVVTALFLLPRYLKGGITTVPQFLAKRFDTSTRTITSALFLTGYVVVLLPVILYSGSVAISGMFGIPEAFGITESQSIYLCVWGIFPNAFFRISRYAKKNSRLSRCFCWMECYCIIWITNFCNISFSFFNRCL